MSKGTLYIVSAPSGAGKTSLLKAVRSYLPELKVATSHTTRAARPGEVNGEDYHFVSKAKFQKMKDNGEFLEFAQVFANFYGTSKQSVNDRLAQDGQVVLEIDWQGAQQVRQLYPQAISIFILPPSVAELESRLRARAQDTEEVIQSRMAQAKSEISHYHEYRYLVINEDIDEAIEAMIGLFAKPIQYSPPDECKLSALLDRIN